MRIVLTRHPALQGSLVMQMPYLHHGQGEREGGH